MIPIPCMHTVIVYTDMVGVEKARLAKTGGRQIKE
jgi:hypothetical protein